jgi:carboxyl-terminal processing protease
MSIKKRVKLVLLLSFIAYSCQAETLDDKRESERPEWIVTDALSSISTSKSPDEMVMNSPHLVAILLAEMGYVTQTEIEKRDIHAFQAALKAFQEDIEIQPTGQLDDRTWQKLSNVSLSANRKAKLQFISSTEAHKTLWAQYMLLNLGYQAGQLGKGMTLRSEMAVIRFQNHHGLKETGSLDDKTFDTLFNAFKNKQTVDSFREESISPELATTISDHHYQHPPLNTLLNLKKVQLNFYLQSLDPYSQYLSPDEFQPDKKSSRSRIKIGLGLNILGNEEYVIVVPLTNGPAYQAGLKQPQFLRKWKGKAVTFKSLLSETPPQYKRGQIVKLGVSKSPLGPIKDYRVKVRAFRQNSIELISEAKTHLIRIHQFISRETAKELKKWLKKLPAHKKIMLDLRYSPGGSLFETLDAVSLFLPAQTPLITLVDEGDYEEKFSALKGEIAQNRAIDILVSPHTASSAEVFSLILKHYGKARIIGTPTEGKCLSQQLFDFEDGSAVKLSVYNILGPNNRSCQNVGIHPDIPIDPHRITDTAFIMNQLKN